MPLNILLVVIVSEPERRQGLDAESSGEPLERDHLSVKATAHAERGHGLTAVPSELSREVRYDPGAEEKGPDDPEDDGPAEESRAEREDGDARCLRSIPPKCCDRRDEAEDRDAKPYDEDQWNPPGHPLTVDTELMPTLLREDFSHVACTHNRRTRIEGL